MGWCCLSNLGSLLIVRISERPPLVLINYEKVMCLHVAHEVRAEKRRKSSLRHKQQASTQLCEGKGIQWSAPLG